MVGYHTVSVQFSCVESPKIRRSRHISQQQGRKNAFCVSMFWTKGLISSSSHETTMPHEGVIFRHNAEIPRHGIFVSCLGIFVSRHGIRSETERKGFHQSTFLASPNMSRRLRLRTSEKLLRHLLNFATGPTRWARNPKFRIVSKFVVRQSLLRMSPSRVRVRAHSTEVCTSCCHPSPYAPQCANVQMCRCANKVMLNMF